MALANYERNELYLGKNYKHQYKNIALYDKNSSHSIIADLIADNSVVLDVGCSYGYIGNWLKINKNCILYGIDNNAEALNYSKENAGYKDVFLIDLDNPSGIDFERFDKFGEIFDYIILADVIENLGHPSKNLILLSQKLKFYSNMLISIPNISNADIILNLIEGKFNYGKEGILDKTHLRFFTRNSFVEWIESLNNEEEKFKFDIDFIANTTYVSSFVNEISMKMPFIYNLLRASNPEVNTLQNIFSLTKVNKNDKIFIDKAKINISGLEKFNDIINKIIEIAEENETNKNAQENIQKIGGLKNIIIEKENIIKQKDKFISVLKNIISKKEPLIFPDDKFPEVSIVISVYNKFEYTLQCLESILNNIKSVSYEVIVIDDCSHDETIFIKNYANNIKIIRNQKNLGFLLSCNNAAKYAKGKYLVLLNNDTIVQPGWLESLLELIKSDELIGMVGSKLIYPSGQLQEAGGIVWKDASAMNFGKWDSPDSSQYNYVKEVDYISGASIMAKKDIWDKIGGFDERFIPAYYEDTDLAFEVRKLGYKVMYQPKSVVTHFEGVTHGKNENLGVKSYMKHNKEKFFEKWKDILPEYNLASAENMFLARDRSRHKKHILIVDWKIPHYDEDAGSKSMWNIVDSFIDLNFKVTFLGDYYYPIQPYTDELQQKGVEVLYGEKPLASIKEWLSNYGKYFAYIFLSRPQIFYKYIKIIRECSAAKILYYGVDIHYMRAKEQLKINKNDKDLEEGMACVKDVEEEIWCESDLIYYPSDSETKIVNEWLLNHKCPQKAKTIPLYAYEETLIPREVNNHGRKDIMFIGGFDHSPNVDGVLWFVNEIMPIIWKQFHDLKFYIVGSNPKKEVYDIASDRVIVTGFVNEDRLRQYYQNISLSVAPLRFGAGLKGKIVESMRFGVPVVTTSIGMQGFDKMKDVILYSDEPIEFANYVMRLIDDDELWKKISLEEISYVRKHFSVNALKKVLLEDIEPVLY